MMYHMDRIATERGYSLCIRFSYTKQDRETEEIDFLLSLGVRGLIIMPSHGEHYNTKILKLVIDGFPVVLIDKSLDGIPVSAVYTDNEASAGMLVDHMVDRGYRDIGLLVTSKDIGVSSIKERKRGFYERITANSLKCYDECVTELSLDAIDVMEIPASSFIRCFPGVFPDRPSVTNVPFPDVLFTNPSVARILKAVLIVITLTLYLSESCFSELSFIPMVNTPLLISDLISSYTC